MKKPAGFFIMAIHLHSCEGKGGFDYRPYFPSKSMYGDPFHPGCHLPIRLVASVRMYAAALPSRTDTLARNRSQPPAEFLLARLSRCLRQ